MISSFLVLGVILQKVQFIRCVNTAGFRCVRVQRQCAKEFLGFAPSFLISIFLDVELNAVLGGVEAV